ncbi:hypothetical protein [Granulicoccus phenolivorans]|uniref:hypothetical protein n=1 Tax=Granulicoccus phenolivorans TaxID=266854 RepID=UPI0003FB7E04|nr:hypothetical protein [Granulicoccus phenolivorans]
MNSWTDLKGPATPSRDAAVAVGDDIVLRLFAAAPLLFLGGAMILDFAFRHHFLDSISAYYGTPVRDVFVGGLFALALIYTIYRGETDLEDWLLDLAGALVVIVALVPSNYGAVPVAEGPVTAQQTLLGTVLLWVGLNAAFQALQFWWRRRVEPFKRSLRRTVTYTAIHVGLLVLLAVLWGLGYIRAVHFTAAIAVVGCLVLTVLTRLRQPSTGAAATGRGTNAGYLIIAGVMLTGLVVGAIMAVEGSGYWVLTVELIEIGAFLAYWIYDLIIAMRRRYLLVRRVEPEVSVADAVRRTPADVPAGEPAEA